MNRQQILLALALREAGIPVAVKEFAQRLVIQKAVCVLQFAGVHLGYRFRWYLRGPYSSDLASDAFWLAGFHELVAEELKGWELDDKSRQIIAGIRELFSGSLPKLAKQLELLASILFIVRTDQAKGENHSQIARILKVNQKPFSVADVARGAATLRDYGIGL